MPKRRRDVKRGVVFLVLGAAVVGGALSLGARVYVAGASVQGRVISVSHSQGESQTCSPLVAYEIEGEQLEWQSDLWSAPCEFSEGDDVDLYYWPDAPGDPYMPSFSRLLLFPGIPAGIGVILLLLAVRAFVGKPPSKKQILRAATRTTAADAPHGAVVVIEGTVTAGDSGATAPITGRPCVAYHARVLVPIEHGDGLGVPFVIEERSAPSRVRDHTGTVQLLAETKTSVYVDADARGKTGSDERAEAVEALLARRVASEAKRREVMQKYVWTEGIVEEGARVLIHGKVARRDAPGGSAYRQREEPAVMEPGPDGTVTLALVDQVM